MVVSVVGGAVAGVRRDGGDDGERPRARGV